MQKEKDRRLNVFVKSKLFNEIEEVAKLQGMTKAAYIRSTLIKENRKIKKKFPTV